MRIYYDNMIMRPALLLFSIHIHIIENIIPGESFNVGKALIISEITNVFENISFKVLHKICRYKTAFIKLYIFNTF